ncbi:MAG: TolC family protein [Planctomycetaceae bacterium]
MLNLWSQGGAPTLIAAAAMIICGCNATSKQQVADSPVLTPPHDGALYDRTSWASNYPRTDNAERSGHDGGSSRDDVTSPRDLVHTVGYADQEDASPRLLAPPAEIEGQPPIVDDKTPVGETAGTDDGATPPDTADSLLQESMPIDLLTALRLGGANHLQIALARERIREAAAQLDQAEVLWIPSVNLGLGYNRHDGRIQDTQGQVFDVSRQSLYAGGGPALGAGAPLSGGASGPARLFVDLSLADVYFQPLVARQNIRAKQFEAGATFNDSLLQVSLLYQELARAQLQIDIAAEAVKNAGELARITENFAKAGEGLEADALRARAELEQRKRELAVARERIEVTSAELVRLLRLDPTVTLLAADPFPVPLDLIPAEVPIEELLSQALTRRPELAQHQSRVAETLEQIRQEQWRPWLPHLFLGYAGAGFGGGEDNDFSNFGGRGDFDALAVWELKNLGLGNRALRQERESQHRQAHLQYEWIRDQVAAEVSQALDRSQYRREQIEHARHQVIAAADALPLNFNALRDRQLRPIEAQQAIVGLASARSLYLASIIDYNRAQLELLRAVGEPPTEGAVPAASATSGTPADGDAALFPVE